MTIPKAVPGQLLPLIYTLASHLTWQNASAATSTLEATFYASLRGGITQTGRLVNWLRETSIGYVHEIQTLFNLANASFIALSAKALLDKAQERYNFSIAKDGYKTWGLKSAALSAGIAGGVFLIGKLLNQVSKPFAEPQTVTKEETVLDEEGEEYTITHTVNIAEKFSLQQQIAKSLHITKLVLDVAAACFIKNRFWLAASLPLSSYSLWKNIQLKWITFTRTFPIQDIDPEVPITQLKSTYHMLALPPSQTIAKESCPVCTEEEVAEAITFCANHAFCKPCLAQIAHEKSANFVNVENIVKTATSYYQNGVHLWTTRKYSMKIDQKNLPHCPTCRDVPLQNTLSIEVTDQVHGKFNAAVTLKRPPVDRQYLFENLYAIYNTAQAGLVFLQTYPELAATIYKIQKGMILPDVIGNVLTTYYLFKKINKKFNSNNSTRFKIATVAAISLIGVLSWYAMLQVNIYFKSAIILNNTLTQTGLSADILKTLSISFNAPMAHKMMQALLLNRIIASAALMFLSKQRKTSLLTVTTQLASLLGISALRWIEVIQMLDEPLQKVVASGGKLVNSLKVENVKSLQITYNFLVNSSCLTHLQSTLKSITNFTENFFNKSFWNRYWMVYYERGVETHRKLHYLISLQNNAVEACSCTLTPHLTGTGIKVIDALFGAAKVITKTSQN